MTDNTSVSSPTDPYYVQPHAADQIELSSGRYLYGLLSSLIVVLLSLVVGSVLLVLGAEIVFDLNGLTDMSEPFFSQLTGLQFTLIVAGLIGVAVISVLLGLKTKRKSDEGFRKMAAVEQKRLRLGEQAAELRKALNEKEQQKRRGL